MARKSSKKKTSKPVNSLDKISSIFSKVKKETPEVDSKPIKDLEENKVQIPKMTEKDFAVLLNKLEATLDEINRIKISIKNECDKARENKEMADAAKLEAERESKKFNIEKSHWEKKNKELLNRENELTTLERELFEKEQEAKLGFAKQNKESLRQLSEEAELLEMELSELRKKASIYTADFEKEKREEQEKWQAKIEERNNKADKILQQDLNKKRELEETLIKTKKEELLKISQRIEVNKMDVIAREEKVNALALQVNSRKKSLDSIINERVAVESGEIIADNKYQEERIESLIDQLTEKQKEMDQFSDLNALLGGESPDSILALNKKLKKKVSKLTQKIDSSPGEDLQENYDELMEDFEDLEVDIQEKDREMSKLKTVLNKKNLFISEHEYSKKMLEANALHTTMYGEKVKQLNDELNKLKDEKKDHQTFKALTEYDEKYKRKDTVYGKQEGENLTHFVDSVRHQMASEGLYYPLEIIQIFIAGLAMSRLHILQGISGTGKTSLATHFAKVVNGIDHNKNEKGLQVVAVQAGWRDGQDLLGYFNVFENRYYETDFLKGLYQAQTPEFKDKPYIILLDEMNLSHPEQYFSNFLSALELKEESQIVSLTSSSVANAPVELIEGSKIKIPSNVWFIGTANHDETTMEFADKTYDRSHVMELPRHKPVEFTPDRSKKCNWTFENLQNAFNEAEKKYEKDVDTAHNFLEAVAEEHLDESFDVGFGNRLKRQLLSFVPVILASGGTIEMAIDHILCTKLLRKGKVTERFDTSETQIKNLIEGIEELWADPEYKLKRSRSPKESLKILNKEYDRKRNK